MKMLKKIMISAAGAFVAVSGGLLGIAAVAAAVVIGEKWKR